MRRTAISWIPARYDVARRTVKDQCLGALDEHHAEVFAFLKMVREIELSRLDTVGGAVASWNLAGEP
jgi:hypothetical protein